MNASKASAHGNTLDRPRERSMSKEPAAGRTDMVVAPCERRENSSADDDWQYKSRPAAHVELKYAAPALKVAGVAC
jgi:hypothetical protein